MMSRTEQKLYEEGQEAKVKVEEWQNRRATVLKTDKIAIKYNNL